MSDHDLHHGDDAAGPAAGHAADHAGDHAADHAGCADALAELYAYLDGECDRVTIERIEIHLRQCSPCLEAFDFEAELKRVVGLRCRESMPPGLRAKLLDLLGAPAEPQTDEADR